jgi:hypothetical protein
MSENTSAADDDALARKLLRAGAEAERQFLKDERKAERRLAAARAALEQDRRRLERAQQRVDRGLQAVAEAEAELRECQLRRAAGPAPGRA